MNFNRNFDFPCCILAGGGFAGEETLVFEAPVDTVICNNVGRAEQKLQEVEEHLAAGYFAVGFLAYELGECFVEISSAEPEFPLLWFGIFEQPRRIQLKSLPQKIRRPGLEAEINKSEYRSGFEKIKDYIRRGETYQVNYTYRARGEFAGPAQSLFSDLFQNHPVPYAAFIDTGRYLLLSLSPELFVRRRGDRLFTRPMKGTVERGKTGAEDRELQRWLRNDPKNRAENLMIVDMLRNDLGRVAKPGSVEVPELFAVEKYETVHQMTSAVSAAVEPATGWTEIMESLFPCGSVTGAPKRRTMKIIREVETSPRKIYTGSIGFLQPTGDFTFNVAIRTLLVDKQCGRAELGVGGGVVADSEPESEWEEAALKSKFTGHKRPDFSLIETMRFSPGEGIPLLEHHLRRLQESAEYFSRPLNCSKIRRALQTKLNGVVSPRMVRLLVDGAGKFSVELKPLPEPVDEIQVALADEPVNSSNRFRYHKTTRRALYDRYRRRAEREDIFDYLFLNEAGKLTEGTITNLFLETDSKLLTPACECGVLPGVMRKQLLEEREAVETKLTPGDLQQAERLLLTNAVRGVIEVDKFVDRGISE